MGAQGRLPNAIEDPLTGERVEFISSARGEDVLRMRLRVTAGGGLLGPHVHPAQEERVVVVGGALAFEFAERAKTLLHAGDELRIPAGVEHAWRNPTNADAVAMLELRPPLNSEAMFRLVFRRHAERAGRGGKRPSAADQTRRR